MMYHDILMVSIFFSFVNLYQALNPGPLAPQARFLPIGHPLMVNDEQFVIIFLSFAGCKFFTCLIVWWLHKGFDPGVPTCETDVLTTGPLELVGEVISCIYISYFWSIWCKWRDRFESHRVHPRNYASEPRLWRHNDVIIGSWMTFPSPHITSHLLINI